MSASFAIREGGLDEPEVAALLRYHHATAHGLLPPGFAHALNLDGLRAPNIRFFSVWEGRELAGVAALRGMDASHAEVKSMRTAPAFLRRGVAWAALAHLIAAARAAGFARLSLETGTSPAFVPANALYEAFGFVDCAAFGGYPPSPHNRFMTLALQERKSPCPR